MTEFIIESRGNVEDKDKLKLVLINLIRELKQTKYKTELIKLSFILDYLYCKEFRKEKGPTTVEYVKYHYGPYSESFIEALNELVQEGVITEVQLQFGVGYAIVNDVKEEVSEETRKILWRVVKEYGNKPLKELKSFIYDTKEFKETDFGKPILLNQ